MPDTSQWSREVLAMMGRIPHSPDCKCSCGRDDLIAAVVAGAIQEGIVAAATLNGPSVIRTIDGGLKALSILKHAQPPVPA